MRYITERKDLRNGVFRFQWFDRERPENPWVDSLEDVRLIIDIRRTMLFEINDEFNIHYIATLVREDIRTDRVLSFLPEMALWRPNRGIGRAMHFRLIDEDAAIPVKQCVRRVEL